MLDILKQMVVFRLDLIRSREIRLEKKKRKGLREPRHNKHVRCLFGQNVRNA